MKNQMMAILALALTPVACGTLAPTSPDEAMGGSNAPGSVTSSTRIPPLPPTGPQTFCTAEAITLSSMQRNGMRIAARFVDGKGGPVSSSGCTAISWTVSPKGAYVQPVPGNGITDSPIVVNIVVTDANQMYTVTASSDQMTASMDVNSQPQPSR